MGILDFKPVKTIKELRERQRKIFVPYKKHLKSSNWKKKREEIKKIFSSRCVLCGRKGNSVHHRTYRNIGTKKEKFDLVNLCVICHNLFHAHYIYNKEKNIFEPRLETINNFREYTDEVILEKIKILS